MGTCSSRRSCADAKEPVSTGAKSAPLSTKISSSQQDQQRISVSTIASSSDSPAPSSPPATDSRNELALRRAQKSLSEEELVCQPPRLISDSCMHNSLLVESPPPAAIPDSHFSHSLDDLSPVEKSYDAEFSSRSQCELLDYPVDPGQITYRLDRGDDISNLMDERAPTVDTTSSDDASALAPPQPIHREKEDFCSETENAEMSRRDTTSEREGSAIKRSGSPVREDHVVAGNMGLCQNPSGDEQFERQYAAEFLERPVSSDTSDYVCPSELLRLEQGSQREQSEMVVTDHSIETKGSSHNKRTLSTDNPTSNNAELELGNSQLPVISDVLPDTPPSTSSFCESSRAVANHRAETECPEVPQDKQKEEQTETYATRDSHGSQQQAQQLIEPARKKPEDTDVTWRKAVGEGNAASHEQGMKQPGSSVCAPSWIVGCTGYDVLQAEPSSELLFEQPLQDPTGYLADCRNQGSGRADETISREATRTTAGGTPGDGGLRKQSLNRETDPIALDANNRRDTDLSHNPKTASDTKSSGRYEQSRGGWQEYVRPNRHHPTEDMYRIPDQPVYGNRHVQCTEDPRSVGEGCSLRSIDAYHGRLSFNHPNSSSLGANANPSDSNYVVNTHADNSRNYVSNTGYLANNGYAGSNSSSYASGNYRQLSDPSTGSARGGLFTPTASTAGTYMESGGDSNGSGWVGGWRDDACYLDDGSRGVDDSRRDFADARRDWAGYMRNDTLEEGKRRTGGMCSELLEGSECMATYYKGTLCDVRSDLNGSAGFSQTKLHYQVKPHATCRVSAADCRGTRLLSDRERKTIQEEDPTGYFADCGQ